MINLSEQEFLEKCLKQWKNVSGYNYHGSPDIQCLAKTFAEIELRIKYMEEKNNV